MSWVLLIPRVVLPVFALLSLGGLVGGTELFSRQDVQTQILSGWHAISQPSFAFSYDRIVGLIILVPCLVIMIESVANRNQPITVLQSTMNVVFADPAGARVVVSRTQYLRANHPDVTAYFTAVAAQFGGTIARAEVQASATAGGSRLTNRLEMPPTAGQTSLEIIHVFEDGMPFGLSNVLLPRFVVKLLLEQGVKLKFVVKRDVTFTYSNEHTGNSTYYQLAADRYAQRDIRINIKFHPDRPPKLINGVLTGQSIKRNGIETFDFANDADVYSTRLRRLHNQKIRIPFNF